MNQINRFKWPWSQNLHPWLVCLTAALFNFYEAFQMSMPDTLHTDIVATFGLSPAQFGNLAAFYLYANMICLLPAGLMLDRFSTRKLLISSMLVSVLGSFLFAIAHNIYFAEFARALEGIGASFCFLGGLRIISRWTPPHQLALASGMLVTSYMLGGMAAQAPLAYLVNILSWREALIIASIIGLFMVLAIALIVKDYPSQQKPINNDPILSLQISTLLTHCTLALKNPKNILCGLYTGLLSFSILTIGSVWAQSYLQEVHRLSTSQAAHIAGLLFFGALFGCMTAGFISDGLKKRRLPMILGPLLTLAVSLAILFMPNLSTTVLASLFFLLGFVSSTQIISYSVILSSNPLLITGTATAIAVIIVLLINAIGEPLFGIILNLFQFIPYLWAMSLISITAFLAFIVAFFITEQEQK